MSVYMTETEQIEAIKRWWERYNQWITIALSIVLLCVAGYKYYHWHNDKVMQQASVSYEKMMLAFSNHNNQAVRSYANELINQYGKTVYADVAHLTLAKIDVQKNKLDKAQVELQAVAQHSHMTSLKQIAKIRIARLLAVNKSYDKALSELSTVEDKAYLPVINELRGDIYGARGQYQEAMSAYKLAIKEIKMNGMGNLFLEMKNNALALKQSAVLVKSKVSV